MDLTQFTFANVQNFISNLGFPIFMCFYFMISRRLDEARQAKILDQFNCLEQQLLETKMQVGKVLPAAAETLAQANQGEVKK